MRSFDYRKFRLFVVHSKLDAEIGRERSQRYPDFFRLNYLKKLRLAVKDRLSGHIKETRAEDGLGGLRLGRMYPMRP